MKAVQYHQTQAALGSDVELAIVTSSSTTKVEAFFREKWQQIFQFERQFSRFLPASELSQFNRSAGIRQPVSPEFRELLISVEELIRQTDGLFNPFILPALQKVGYKQSFVAQHEKDLVDDHSNKSVVSTDRLVVGKNWATIPYGTAIDLGGIGKGFFADKLQLATPSWITGLWYSIGGDIVTRGVNESGQPWKVNILDNSKLTYNMPTTPYAIATSGTLKRQGINNGKSWHHIIDPRTLLPSKSDILTATVTHESAIQADVLATCAVILGSKQATRFLKARGVTACLLQIQSSDGPKLKHFGRGFVMLTGHPERLAT